MKSSIKINNVILKYIILVKELLNFKKLNKRKNKVILLTFLHYEIIKYLKLNNKNNIINN